MTVPFYIPTEDDFLAALEDANEAVDAITSFCNIMDTIMKQKDVKNSNYTDFSERVVPKAFNALFNDSRQIRKISNEVPKFTHYFILFLVTFDLSPKLLQSVASILQIISKEFSPIVICLPKYDNQTSKLTEIEESKLNKILADNSESPLLDESSLSQNYNVLISELFKCQVFLTFFEMVKKKTATIQQLSSIIKIFTYIEPYIKENLITIITPFLIDTTINMLQNQKSDYDGLVQFVASFYECLPDYQDEIIQLLISLMGNGPAQSRFTATSSLTRIAQKYGLGNQADIVKNACLKIICSEGSSLNTRQILGFFSLLSKQAKFYSNDLITLLQQIHVDIENLCSILTDILPNIEGSLDDLGSFLVNSDIISPRLYCEVIGRIESEDLSRNLFLKLLKSSMIADQNSHYEPILMINPRMSFHMQELLSSKTNLELLIPLSVLLMNVSNHTELRVFILKLVELSAENPNFISVLGKFANILNCGDNITIITTLFNSVYSMITNYNSIISQNPSMTPELMKQRKDVDESIRVLTQWISEASEIPKSHIFTSLRKLNFSYCTNAYPPFLAKVIEKLDDISKTKLLLKLVRDTFPPRHSHWLSHQLCLHFHTDLKKMDKITEILISQIQNPETRSRAVALMKQLVLYEADYYRLGDDEFPLKLQFENEQFNLSIGFHPYHSTRRIFLEYSRELNVSLNSFYLLYHKRNLLTNLPLSSIEIDGISPIPLSVKMEQRINRITSCEVQPFFLESLESHINDLFNVLNVEANPTIALILLLFKHPEFPIATSPIQKLLIDKCDDPLLFKDSIQLFPFSVASYSFNYKDEVPSEIFKEILLTSITHVYDPISEVILNQALTRLQTNFQFDSELLLQSVLEPQNEYLCQAAASHFLPKLLNNNDNPYSAEEMEKARTIIRFLIPRTTFDKYRTKTKQFFKCCDRAGITSQEYWPLFEQLPQFEITSYGEIDETWIALLDRIPINSEAALLVYNRLIETPTAKHPNAPFVQTYEARAAGFHFLSKPEVFPFIADNLNILVQNLSFQNFIKLSDDVTMYGRTGIQNLGTTCYVNALMQSMNTITNFTDIILTQTGTSMKPFIHELRNFLARLRFSRSKDISIRSFAETIPDFDAFIQMDAEEFLTTVLDSVIKQMPDGKETVSEQLQGKIERSIINSNPQLNTVYSKHTEPFFVLPLTTKNLDDIQSAFRKCFEDTPIDEGYRPEGEKEKVHAFSRTRIVQWPKTLIIQLQRYDFDLTTGYRTKLVHEFTFPLILSRADIDPTHTDSNMNETDDDDDYMLTAVVVHEGDTDSGHYFAIVRSEEGEDWYSCNDNYIEFFDIMNLPQWAFGVNEKTREKSKSICTGYLLFYRKKGEMKTEKKPTLPPDLEEAINEENEKIWPTRICYSSQFLDSVLSIVESCPGNIEAAVLAFRIYLRIACGCSSILPQWEEVCTKLFSSTDIISAFFSILNENVSTRTDPNQNQNIYRQKNKESKFEKERETALSAAVSASDDAADSVSKVIASGINFCLSSTEPLIAVLKALENQTNKRALNVSYYTIIEACSILNVQWTDEYEALKMMVSSLIIDMPKETQRLVKNFMTEAFESVVKILNEVLPQRGVIEPIIALFDDAVLNRLSPIMNKSESFLTLVQLANSMEPGILGDLSEASSQVKSMFASIIKETQTISVANNINLSFIEPALQTVCNKFLKASSEKDFNLMNELEQVLTAVIPTPPLIIQNYLKNKIFNPNLMEPTIFEEDSYSHFLLGLLEDGIEITDIPNLFLKLTYSAPFSASCYAQDALDALISKPNDQRLADALLNIFVMLDNFTEKVSKDSLKLLYNQKFSPSTSVKLALLIPEYANGSPLLANAITDLLSAKFSSESKLMCDLLTKGCFSENFIVPEHGSDPMNLEFANKLWNIFPEKRNELANYMFNLLSSVIPLSIFKDKSPFKETLKYLNEIMPQKIQILQSQNE